MDVTASLIAIVDLSLKVLRYIKEVKDGGKERKQLNQEILTVHDVVEGLKSEFESHESDEADDWLKPIKPLFNVGGTIEQLTAVLEELKDAVVTPSEKALAIGKKLKWPFQKDETQKMLGRLKSLKEDVSFALTRANLAIGRKIDTGVDQIRSVLDIVALENAIKWISSLDFRMSQKGDQKQPLDGTGKWFLDDPQVRGWSDRRTKALWCHGIPGAGKTVLASAMFQQLREQHSTANVMVLVAYCSFDDKNTHSAYNILCSFVRQLVEQRGTMPESVKKLYAEHGNGLQQSRPDLAKVVQTISTELKTFDSVFIILDGLDELPDNHQRKELLRTLEDIDPLPQLMVTSRPVRRIEEWFNEEAREERYQLRGDDLPGDQAYYRCDNCDDSGSLTDSASSSNYDIMSLDSNTTGEGDWRDKASYRCQNKECGRDICVNCYDEYDICLGCSSPKSCFQWAWPGSMTITANDQDLRHYIAWRIDRSDNLTTMAQNALPRLSDLRDRIIHTVCKEANGMFLLAKFHMNSLQDESNTRELLNGLDTLPSKMTQIYDGVISRISNNKQATVLKDMILIVATARQLLSLDALAHALSLEYGDGDIDELKLPSIKHLVSMCAGLLELDYSGVVRLTHETIGDYIAQNGLNGSKNGHSTLAMKCLIYLHFSTFASGACSGPNHKELIEERRQKYPLLAYAATHWGIHVREIHDETQGPSIVNKLATDFVRDDAHVAAASQFMWLDNLETSSGWDAASGVHGLHLCAYFGLTAITSELSTKTTDLDVEDCHKTTPLMYAAQNGHTDIVHFLLHAGADPRRVCSRGSTVLHRACRRGHGDVVKEIARLPKDVRVNELDVDANNYSALMHAVLREDADMVKALLSRQDIDVELQRPGKSRSSNALLLAVIYNYTDMVKILLSDDRVSPESLGPSREPPLTIAAWKDNDDIVAALLDHGANIESQDLYGGTALFRAIDGNSLNCVQVLVNRGADHTAKDRFGRTILHSCAINGRSVIMRYLLEVIPTLDVNVQGDRGETPLHDAVKHNLVSVVRVLVDHGARTDIENNSGHTPLRAAHDNDLPRLFAALRQVRLRESENQETLLSNQAPDASGEGQFRPPRRRDTLASGLKMTIHLASRKLSRVDLENYLNDLGSDSAINECDNDYTPPLHVAIRYGRGDNVRLLLERGADIQSRDSWGFTPLHHAVDAPPNFDVLDVLNSLLQHPGCDINAVENYGRSPLDFALKERYRPDCACVLLRQKAQFEAHDASLLRLLHYAIETNDIEVVKILADGGVPLHIRGMGRLTPYQRAKQAGHDELAQYLFEWNRNRKHFDTNAPLAEVVSVVGEPTHGRASNEAKITSAENDAALINAVESTGVSKYNEKHTWPAVPGLWTQMGLSKREQGFLSVILLLCVLLYWK